MLPFKIKLNIAYLSVNVLLLRTDNCMMTTMRLYTLLVREHDGCLLKIKER